MDRVHVSSKHLESVGYDPLNRLLEIRFLDGSIYLYKNVPEALFKGLMSASSKGTFFRDKLRNNPMYPSVKVNNL
ncbi:KTSC domain-containing protein [Cloacibacillus evryensis]|uniref:KTSC domain-containing protein n=1 Tax=Cloacibacillus evryensis TaxID=508460 RepID=UPI002B1FBC6D|nr:KTSC domain-containing protein [Cloacibacillus evryensis]MEA5034216.1 KTSC domain-containing protein [Cloacibacillus evryensis]